MLLGYLWVGTGECRLVWLAGGTVCVYVSALLLAISWHLRHLTGWRRQGPAFCSFGLASQIVYLTLASQTVYLILAAHIVYLALASQMVYLILASQIVYLIIAALIVYLLLASLCLP